MSFLGWISSSWPTSKDRDEGDGEALPSSNPLSFWILCGSRPESPPCRGTVNHREFRWNRIEMEMSGLLELKGKQILYFRQCKHKIYLILRHDVIKAVLFPSTDMLSWVVLWEISPKGTLAQYIFSRGFSIVNTKQMFELMGKLWQTKMIDSKKQYGVGII